MPRWLPQVLKRIRALAASGAVRLTYKAEGELVALGLVPEDVRDVLTALKASDSCGRLASRRTGEWLYVFKPLVRNDIVYVKVVLRKDCVVVSFHEDEGADHEEDE